MLGVRTLFDTPSVQIFCEISQDNLNELDESLVILYQDSNDMTDAPPGNVTRVFIYLSAVTKIDPLAPGRF